MNIINEKGLVIGRSIGEELTLEKILFKNPVKQPALFMRKSLLEKLGHLREDLHFVMDREFWLRIVINNIKKLYLRSGVCKFQNDAGTKLLSQVLNFIRVEQVLNEYHKNDLFSNNNVSLVIKAISYTKGDWYFSRMRDKEEVKGFYNFK